MKPSAVMSEEAYATVPDLLRAHGIQVEPHENINEFKMLRCSRDGAAILLAVSKPPHWATATDERRDKVVVAAVEESLFRFWRIPRDRRLRAEIFDLLRPHEWQPR